MAQRHEITVQQASDRLREDYWDDVRAVVADARAEIESGTLERDRDAIREYLEQTIDGHERVIYTHQALLTLVYAENHDAGPEEMGDDGGWVKDGSINVSGLAYWAMLQDVMEQAESEDLFDPADEDESEDDAEEE